MWCPLLYHEKPICSKTQYISCISWNIGGIILPSQTAVAGNGSGSARLKELTMLVTHYSQRHLVTLYYQLLTVQTFLELYWHACCFEIIAATVSAWDEQNASKCKLAVLYPTWLVKVYQFSHVYFFLQYMLFICILPTFKISIFSLLHQYYKNKTENTSRHIYIFLLSFCTPR